MTNGVAVFGQEKEIFFAFLTLFRLQHELLSIPGRMNYTINNKYILTLSARGDKSSALAAGSGAAPFYS
jgi:hypothetical protein